MAYWLKACSWHPLRKLDRLWNIISWTLSSFNLGSHKYQYKIGIRKWYDTFAYVVETHSWLHFCFGRVGVLRNTVFHRLYESIVESYGAYQAVKNLRVVFGRSYFSSSKLFIGSFRCWRRSCLSDHYYQFRLEYTLLMSSRKCQSRSCKHLKLIVYDHVYRWSLLSSKIFTVSLNYFLSGELNWFEAKWAQMAGYWQHWNFHSFFLTYCIMGSF